MSALAMVFGSLDPVPEPGELKPGIFYALLVLGLVAATIFLWLNMRKQLRRVDFEEQGPDGPAPADAAAPADQVGSGADEAGAKLRREPPSAG